MSTYSELQPLPPTTPILGQILAHASVGGEGNALQMAAELGKSLQMSILGH